MSEGQDTTAEDLELLDRMAEQTMELMEIAHRRGMDDPDEIVAISKAFADLSTGLRRTIMFRRRLREGRITHPAAKPAQAAPAASPSAPNPATPARAPPRDREERDEDRPDRIPATLAELVIQLQATHTRARTLLGGGTALATKAPATQFHPKNPLPLGESRVRVSLRPQSLSPPHQDTS